MRTLRNMAASGRLPGAFRLHATGNYRVNLAEYDRAVNESLRCASNDDDSAESIAASILAGLQ